MTDDTDKRSDKPLTVAVAAAPIIRNLYRLMNERKKAATEAHLSGGAAVASDGKPTGVSVGSAREGK